MLDLIELGSSGRNDTGKYCLVFCGDSQSWSFSPGNLRPFAFWGHSGKKKKKKGKARGTVFWLGSCLNLFVIDCLIFSKDILQFC